MGLALIHKNPRRSVENDPRQEKGLGAKSHVFFRGGGGGGCSGGCEAESASFIDAGGVFWEDAEEGRGGANHVISYPLRPAQWSSHLPVFFPRTANF